MMEEQVNESGIVTLQWSGDLTIRRITELKGELHEALQGATSVSIEIAPDAECDTTLLQLLCAAHRTASRQEKTLRLCGEFSEQFKMVMNLAGFARHVGCALDVCGDCLWKLVYPQLTTAEKCPVVEPTCTNH